MVGLVRDIDRMRRGNAGGERAVRGKGVGAVAAQHARHAPEGVGNQADGPAAAVSAVERHIVIVGHARHDERSRWSDCFKERLDQALRGGTDLR